VTVRLPAWLQTGSYTAELDRQVATALLTPSSATGARGGVRRWSGNEFQVVPTGPATMQVAVKPGMAWIQGAFSSAQGAYAVMNDADVVLAIAGAHPTLARIDLVVLEVLDSTYSGSSNLGQLRVVTGTAAASPALPSVTGSYIVLAQVRVSAAVTSIITSAITDVRPYVSAVGGYIPVKNATERVNLTGLSSGAEALELDTGRVYQWGYGASGGWVYAYGGTSPVVWITPTLINGWSLFPATGTTWRGPRYRKNAIGQVEMQGIVQSGSGGPVIFQLPAGYRPGLQTIFAAAAGDSGNNNVFGRFDVLADGSVYHMIPSNPKWVSLTCVFTPDQ
jgi:hypothetical protein